MTPQDILNGGYAKSKKNQPGRIIAESTEGLDVANRIVRVMFLLGMRVNPHYFIVPSTVAFAGSGWARPAAAEAVWRIETEAGAEVVTVPRNDRAAESGKPAVYRLGNTYYGAGNAGDPTSGNLVFLAATRPTDAADLTTAIDTRFPAAYADLLYWEAGAHMAFKDGRMDELAHAAAERDKWLLLWLSFLEHETMNEVRRWDDRFSVPSMVPIGSMLTGGTSVRLAGGGA